MSVDIRVSESCPRCETHFVNCSLIKETESHLKLKCEKCLEQYSLRNSEEQRKCLSTKYGIPAQIVQLTKIDQLREGDAIGFKREMCGIRYEHHAIVVAVNKDEETVDVVEFDSKSKENYFIPPIVDKRMDFKKDIESENAWLRQYMPLDCYPRERAVDEAKSFIVSSKQPKYDITRFNCQHLTSLCKTGKLISEEAENIRPWYICVMGGAIVISAFVCPVLAIGLCAVDATSRIVRTIRTSLNLIEQKIADPDIIKRDLLGLIACEVGIGSTFAVTAGLAKVGLVTVAKVVFVAKVGAAAAAIVAVPLVSYGIYKFCSWLFS